MIEGKNFQYEEPTDFETVNDGDEFFKCNLSQSALDTVILSGKKDLKFVRCNLENVKLDPTWKTDGMCYTAKTRNKLIGGKWEKEKHLGRHKQDKLITKQEMEAIAEKVTNKQLKQYAKGAVNDISRHYKPKALTDITIKETIEIG